MRLAFVTSLLPPARPDTGFEIATASVLEALRSAGCEVVAFGCRRPDDDTPDDGGIVCLARFEIENARASKLQKIRWIGESLARRQPVISAKLAAAVPAQRLRERLDRRGPFDGVIINSAPVAGAYPFLARGWPSILVAHNVEHVSASQNAADATGTLAVLYRREAMLLKAIENATVRHVRYIWCLAEEDRTGFGVDLADTSCVMPLLSGIQRPLPEVEAQHDIGLIGTWTWRPNLMGLEWFLQEVVPHLPETISIAVAGRTPENVSAPARIAMLGRVPDARAFLASCRAVALTSRAGTGVQLKTIEAFQYGLPSVATRLSVRGQKLLPPNCLVTDDARTFAASIEKLVAALRTERATRADGAAFIADQRSAIRTAVMQGLQALKPKG